MGNFQVAIENPESWGGDTANDSVPDVIARYNIEGDWGSISVSGLARQLNTSLGNSESAFGASIAGRINTTGKDDIRFQFHKGELGRYVGVAAVKDLYLLLTAIFGLNLYAQLFCTEKSKVMFQIENVHSGELICFKT